MFEVFLTSLANFGLSSNIVVSSGSGALLFGREKKYRFFRYLSLVFLIFGVAICSVADYFLNKFIYAKFDLHEIRIGVLVILACLYNLGVSAIWKKASLFGNYLYNGSCLYVFDTVFTIFVAMTLDFSLDIVPFMMSVLAVVVVIVVMNILIGFFVESINKSNLRICFRNVSARLYLLAIFAILLFYANMII